MVSSLSGAGSCQSKLLALIPRIWKDPAGEAARKEETWSLVMLVRESLMPLENQHLCHHPGFGFHSSSGVFKAFPHVRVREGVGVGRGVGEEMVAQGQLWHAYMSRCAGSIFVQFIWLLFSCIHYVQKATQRERENIQALAHPISSLQSISNRPLRGWKVSVLYLRRYR